MLGRAQGRSRASGVPVVVLRRLVGSARILRAARVCVLSQSATHPGRGQHNAHQPTIVLHHDVRVLFRQLYGDDVLQFGTDQRSAQATRRRNRQCPRRFADGARAPACNFGEVCVTPTYNNNSNATCQGLLGLGAVCSGANVTAYYNGTKLMDMCAPGRECVDGTCKIYSRAGQSCAPDWPLCQPGTTCVDFVCLFNAHVECLSSRAACVPGYSCGFQQTGVLRSTCGTVAGGSCAQTSDCTTDLLCSNGICAPPLLTNLTNGQPCEIPAQCAKKACSQSKCAQAATVGSACNPMPCVLGSRCSWRWSSYICVSDS